MKKPAASNRVKYSTNLSCFRFHPEYFHNPHQASDDQPVHVVKYEPIVPKASQAFPYVLLLRTTLNKPARLGYVGVT